MKKPFVVAFSGYSGSGKSTLINHLAQVLPSSVSLFFDDYASRRNFPSDIVSWIQRGGDSNEITTPLLKEHLLRLLNREPVHLNKSNGWAEEYGVNNPAQEIELSPADYILLEEPFGKLRNEMLGLIDMLIYLDVDPEVSLGRRIHDLVKCLKSDPEVLINLLDHFLYDYLYGGVREMYFINGIRVKDQANLIVDARAELGNNVVFIKNEILKANKKS